VLAEQAKRTAVKQVEKLRRKVAAFRTALDVREVSSREHKNACAQWRVLSKRNLELEATLTKNEVQRAGLEAEGSDAAREIEELECQVNPNTPTPP
jgi:hypothetical protein